MTADEWCKTLQKLGCGLPRVGICSAQLLQRLAKDPVPLEVVERGRQKKAVPVPNLGPLIRNGLATLVDGCRYEATGKGRAWLEKLEFLGVRLNEL